MRPNTRHTATPKKLTADYLTGLVADQGKTESRRTLTQLPELPRALLRIVAVGTGMALGADPAQLSGLVLWQVARMTLVGGTIGLAAALGLGTAARSLLYGLGGYDPLVVSLSVVLLMLVAFGAGLLPALRASRINPVRAHRWQ